MRLAYDGRAGAGAAAGGITTRAGGGALLAAGALSSSAFPAGSTGAFAGAFSGAFSGALAGDFSEAGSLAAGVPAASSGTGIACVDEASLRRRPAGESSLEDDVSVSLRALTGITTVGSSAALPSFPVEGTSRESSGSSSKMDSPRPSVMR